MGRLGFLFTIEKELKKEFIVVFTENDKISKDIILGIENLKVKDTKFYILDKYNDLTNFYVLDNAILKFGRISLAKDKIVDFQDFVFWLSSEYRMVRQLLLIDSPNENLIIFEELKERVVKLVEIFEKYIK